jgi:hypothetical protein
VRGENSLKKRKVVRFEWVKMKLRNNTPFTQWVSKRTTRKTFMIATSTSTAKPRISGIEVTSDLLADRGGLALLMKYIDHTSILPALAQPFDSYRQNQKGCSVETVFRQVLAFLCDGTSRHLTRFDEFKRDQGYQALLGLPSSEMVSSHQVKRLFAKFPRSVWSPMRHLLRRMFATRLRQAKPQVVELFLDTMVLANDDAETREGCQPNYKKVKGFQPLQLIWDGMIVDAQFRGGSKNGNHGKTAFTMIDKAVKVIRQTLGYQVAVMVRMDGGFFDGDLFSRLDATNIGFICSGRLSPEIKAVAAQQATWETLEDWRFFEFATRCHAWDRFYRAIFLRRHFEEDQQLLEFARPDTVFLTNMGSCPHLFRNIGQETRAQLCRVENLIAGHHAKGADELTHRRLKDFGFEQLPFKNFEANMGFYYLMVIAYNLMEWYKRDILVPRGLAGKGSYAGTIRRTVIDFAAKIVASGRRLVMKVMRATMDRLELATLWDHCKKAPLLI